MRRLPFKDVVTVASRSERGNELHGRVVKYHQEDFIYEFRLRGKRKGRSLWPTVEGPEVCMNVCEVCTQRPLLHNVLLYGIYVHQGVAPIIKVATAPE